ncbi:spexin prohormone 1-like [Antennarius striatus]|uniref:spexin prohormone 1-like n=1 Tax=Antennarius striatus TaxID=241820 RepID=UPI0035B4F214
MSPVVTLLVMTLVSHCWSAPHWKNWTPQAILYLKGSQGHRSVLERQSREEGDALHFVHRDQSRDGLFLSSVLQEFVQQAVKEGAANPDIYPDEQEMDVFL